VGVLTFLTMVVTLPHRALVLFGLQMRRLLSDSARRAADQGETNLVFDRPTEFRFVISESSTQLKCFLGFARTLVTKLPRPRSTADAPHVAGDECARRSMHRSNLAGNSVHLLLAAANNGVTLAVMWLGRSRPDQVSPRDTADLPPPTAASFLLGMPGRPGTRSCTYERVPSAITS
jgi:hypothetical protein